MKPKVTGFRYDDKNLEEDLRNAFEQVDWKNYVKSNCRIFVKPNYTAPFYKPGVTTNGNVIEATLRILKEQTPYVYIGESDGGNGSYTAEYAFENHKLSEICDRTGAKLINLSKAERIRIVDIINGKKVEVTVPRPLLGMDITLSIPVMKVHAMTTVSLSIKNMWGCHPDTYRLFDHPNLDERLSLIAKAIKLKLVVIDAIYGLNKQGPMHGEVVNVGGILVGNNPVAIDSVATRLMGFNPEKVKHIVVANKADLGPYNKDEIDIVEDISQFQNQFCLQKNLLDRVSVFPFRYSFVNNLVFRSPFTKTIYFLVGRKYGRKILYPGDEL